MKKIFSLIILILLFHPSLAFSLAESSSGEAARISIYGKTSGGVLNSVLMDGSGSLSTNTNLSTLISGEDQSSNRIVTEQRYSYANITTTTTTVVKNGAGFLNSITINTPVASSVITVYDNTAGSGTKIATITLPATLLSDGPISIPYNVICATGLTIVTGTGAFDITVSFR